MRINILGGGPGGLYFALLMKKHDPLHDIHVYERGPRDATWGFGVVFSDDTLGGFLEYDARSFQAIVDSFAYWDKIRTVIETDKGDKSIVSGGHGFAGMSRLKLLNIFHDRCDELGVNLHFNTDITDVNTLLDADLVVAADGITSLLREEFKEELGTTMDMRPNHFCWLGTSKPLDAFTFIFRQTEHGWFWVHAYQFEEGKATWLVETSDETWMKAGLDKMSEEESKDYMEQIFAPDLDGHALLTNRSVWRTFPVVKNAKWHHDNVIIIGDCAHTAHFSIGSGTKMAMEDSIALFEAFKQNETVKASLPAYEEARREVTEILQHTAGVSLQWFEHTDRYLNQFEPEQTEFSMITRSKKITYENLALRDQGYIDGIASWFADYNSRVTGLEAAKTGDRPAPPALQPYKIGEMVVPNRITLSPMCQYCANDGDIDNWHLVHYGGRATGGVGLILTEMICISESARITPGCAGLYTDKQAMDWKGIVDFTHKHSKGKICAQLGHAGRKGATRLPRDGMDQPLQEGGWDIISASPIPYLKHSVVPREATRADMDQVLEDYVVAVRNADTAGFDMIEVHMAHGYLLSSFISPITNIREDEYGGDIHSRMKFPLECLKLARETWPKNKPISVRISASDWTEDGLTESDMLEVARLLKANGADVINVSTGQVTKDEQPVYGRMFQVPFADQVRNEIGIPTIVAGNISTMDQANTVVASGRTDFVAFARPLLTNPNMVLQEAARYGHSEQYWPEQYTSGKFQAGLLAERENDEMRELRINAKPPSPADALALALGRKELT
ncbi:MAG: FAD-dependent monooxygenase [Arenicella sp.]|nr:FAD-dependent monooxygenase [Arenicella sp.]